MMNRTSPSRHARTGRPAVLVTGASSGIGAACVQRLAAAGFDVFAGVRRDEDAQRLRASVPERITTLLLDVTDRQAIATARATIAERVGSSGFGALVNNAGVGMAAPLELLELERLRSLFEVNVFGQLAVTQAMLPLLRAGRGRVVTIGSAGIWLRPPYAGALTASKSAVTTLNDTLRLEVEAQGVRVITVEPGLIASSAVDKVEKDARARLAAMDDEQRALYAAPFATAMRRALRAERRGSSPDAVAVVVLRALTAERPRRTYAAGRGGRALRVLGRTAPPAALDGIRRRLTGAPSVRASRPSLEP